MLLGHRPIESNSKNQRNQSNWEIKRLAYKLLFSSIMLQNTKLGTFEKHALGYLKDLYSTALRYSRDEKDAEDLVQETMLRAFAAWEQFQHGTNCRAWLFRILTNNFINEYRRIHKERNWLNKNEPLLSPARRRAAQDPEGAFIDHHFADEVLQALMSLPEEFRRVVIFTDVQGMSYREVADVLNCPIGTVMSRLYRARRILEEALQEYAQEHGIRRRVAA